MPIDRSYRETWKVSTHNGTYNIWVHDMFEGSIHGTIVGVHLKSCIGCMKCLDSCPTKVFTSSELERNEVVIPENERDCIFCMVCELICPTNAISVDSHVGSDETLDSLLGNV